MSSIGELIEKYIDQYDGEREYVEKLTLEEQVLYKCRLRDTLSFTLFACHELICEFANTVIEDFLGLFDRGDKKSKDEEESVEPYVEHDTMCDKCGMIGYCISVNIVRESTALEDSRKHYIPILGGYCPGYVKDRKKED